MNQFREQSYSSIWHAICIKEDPQSSLFRCCQCLHGLGHYFLQLPWKISLPDSWIIFQTAMYFSAEDVSRTAIIIHGLISWAPFQSSHNNTYRTVPWRYDQASTLNPALILQQIREQQRYELLSSLSKPGLEDRNRRDGLEWLGLTEGPDPPLQQILDWHQDRTAIRTRCLPSQRAMAKAGHEQTRSRQTDSPPSQIHREKRKQATP